MWKTSEIQDHPPVPDPMPCGTSRDLTALATDPNAGTRSFVRTALVHQLTFLTRRKHLLAHLQSCRCSCPTFCQCLGNEPLSK